MQAWVSTWFNSHGTCGRHIGTGMVLSKFFRFHVNIIALWLSIHITWGMNNRPVGGCSSETKSLDMNKTMCFFRLPLSLDVLLHTSQDYGCFHYVCTKLFSHYHYQWMIYYTHQRLMDSHHYVLMYLEITSLNDHLITYQSYGWPPLCLHWCILRLPLQSNDLLHTPQAYGRSPPCMRSYTFRSLLLQNDLLHTLHAYGLSTMYALMNLQITPIM
jgi:hypothetical protein